MNRIENEITKNTKTGMSKMMDSDYKKELENKTIWLVEAKKLLDTEKLKGVKNLHEYSGHRSEEALLNMLKGAKKFI